MKSLVEEASSVVRAIEKAWARAGKPQSFSVKIFEEPRSGFLGFNSKPAKIGIFFEETQVSRHERESHGRPHRNSRGGRNHNGERQHKTPRERHAQNHPNETFAHPQRCDGKTENAQSENREKQSEKSQHDRPRRHGQRNDRSRGRNEKRGGQARHINRTHSEHEKQQPITPQKSSEPSTPSPATPTTPEPPKSTRRILKVSSRRYIAPEKSDGSGEKN